MSQYYRLKHVPVFFIAVTCLAWLHSSCSNSDIKALEKKAGQDNAAGTNEQPKDQGTIEGRSINSENAEGENLGKEVSVDEKSGIVTEKLNLYLTRKLDMVWIIDNSSSLANEAQLIRDNFPRFLQFPKNNSVDLKLAVVSTREKRIDLNTAGSSYLTGVNLPEEQIKNGDKQIDVIVGSRNLLALAASATCEPEATQLLDSGGRALATAEAKMCGKPLAGLAPPVRRNLEHPVNVQKVAGELRKFFREEVPLAFVFVTDDIPWAVTQETFLELIGAEKREFKPVIFGFVGKTSTPDCQIIFRGSDYEALAEVTGGKTFDICEKNWSRHFDDLIDASLQIATVFKLKFVPATIKSINVDGKALDDKQYSLKDRTLRILDKEVLKGREEIEVVYQRN